MLELDQLEAAGYQVIPCGCPALGGRFEGFMEMAGVSKAYGCLIVAR